MDRVARLDILEGVAARGSHGHVIYHDIRHLISGIRGYGKGLGLPRIHRDIVRRGDAPVLPRTGGYRISLADKGGMDRMARLDILECVDRCHAHRYAIHQDIRHPIPDIRSQGEGAILA